MWKSICNPTLTVDQKRDVRWKLDMCAKTRTLDTHTHTGKIEKEETIWSSLPPNSPAHLMFWFIDRPYPLLRTKGAAPYAPWYHQCHLNDALCALVLLYFHFGAAGNWSTDPRAKWLRVHWELIKAHQRGNNKSNKNKDLQHRGLLTKAQRDRYPV